MFLCAEEVEVEEEKLDVGLVEELAVEGEPNTELIVGLDTIVINNIAIEIIMVIFSKSNLKT